MTDFRVPQPRPWWDLTFETKVVLGVIALMLAIFVPLFIWVAHVEHQRAVQRAHCERTGGLYIDARDYHHCLYGVRTVK